MIGQTAEQRSLERPITTGGQLLVEGRVPEMFFREMVSAFELANLVEVRTFGDIGKENLQTYLELFTQKAQFKEQVSRLGIIRDAERAPASSAFQSVQAALQGAQLPVPEAVNKLEGSPLAVGVFILPNCSDAGMLETLCLSAVTEVEKAQPASVLPCVDEFFTCITKCGQGPSNPTKAQFAGYALARDVVDPQLGRAAQKGVIPWQAKAFDLLKVFIRNVAGQ
jgi:hypothetical protein